MSHDKNHILLRRMERGVLVLIDTFYLFPLNSFPPNLLLFSLPSIASLLRGGTPLEGLGWMWDSRYSVFLLLHCCFIVIYCSFIHVLSSASSYYLYLPGGLVAWDDGNVQACERRDGKKRTVDRVGDDAMYNLLPYPACYVAREAGLSCSSLVRFGSVSL
ncbi:hypothetical protein B0T24DRAFT_399615 [Lasiosphaeria ovina]|uniref:Uncharacterized protein n=1 Tax=Lasiosphaeria ovina TaxID=92902 RepID=A0AAE0JY00_9PEZI|nr:hypothetical protein B0T24DRAFT_399615 [Lasiosphaeria ovina]